MAENFQSAKETDSTRENRKWHLSWIIASLVAVVVGAILAWSGLDMIPSILIVALGWILATALLWLMTPARLHTVVKISASLILLICTLLSVLWIYSVDRPILFPEIGGIITQAYNGSALSIDVEALVKNTGRQSSYADSWRLDLMIDGTTIQGRELYGEALPEHAASELPLFDQEFPPGKPVRGWLFFAFPGVSHDYAATYFTCGSPLMEKVSLRLSVWDSKMKREWSEARSLKDMGKEACTSLPPTPTAPPPLVLPKTQGPSPTREKSQRSKTPVQTQPSVGQPSPQTQIPAVNQLPSSQSCPNGICISGGQVDRPTVNNFEAPPSRHLTSSQVTDLAAFAKSQPDVNIFSFLSSNDIESVTYASEILAPFKALGNKNYSISLYWPPENIRKVCVCIHDQDDSTLAAAQALANILGRNGFDMIFSTSSSVKAGTIEIVVGPEPDLKPQ
jgi:hypothetical protein